MKALITTTINVPEVLTKWAATMNPGDHIIVAGDLRTPHERVERLMNAIEEKFDVHTNYLAPFDQDEWKSSVTIGWNSIQRRNIALLEAMRVKPDVIITIDDDNAPTTTDQLNVLESLFTESAEVLGVRTPTRWFDAGSRCNAKNGWGQMTEVVHRGYPTRFRFDYQGDTVEEIADTSEWPVGVAAMLWTGEPDVDAVDRISQHPVVETVEHGGVKLLPGTWCPFNTQATAFRADLAPLMFVWPHVGRYDDIWASFLARRVMDHLGYSAYYGHPVVHQDRNEHDLVRDLEAEVFGMRWNQHVIDALREIDPAIAEGSVGVLRYVYEELDERLPFLPRATKNAFDTWLIDIVAATEVTM